MRCPRFRLKTLAYVLSGFTAGVGGLILAARLSAVSPGVGNNIQFDVILAVVLGGASLTGGSGRLEKSLLGALIAGMILNYPHDQGNTRAVSDRRERAPDPRRRRH